MDKRLQLALRNGDFYAAHQQLLSQVQRLERSSRYEEALDLLVEGLRALTDAPLATLADVALKLFSIMEQHVGGVNVENLTLLLSVQSRVGANWRATADKAIGSWKVVAGDAEKMVGILEGIDGISDEDVLLWLTSASPLDADLFGRFSQVSFKAKLVSGLTLIAGQHFKSASRLCLSLEVRNDETDALVAVDNLLILLSELCRVERPSKTLLDKLRGRYGYLFDDDTCADSAWRRVEMAYWPSNTSARSPNPLASMLQSLLVS